jgi:DNA-binding response OmpR family regulator
VKKILILDDEEDVATSLAMALRLQEWDAFPLTNPSTALDLVAKSPPALIITDYMMPWMSGREFCAAVRSIPSARMPIIMYSGVDPGAPVFWDEFVKKPLDIPRFIALVRHHLGCS